MIVYLISSYGCAFAIFDFIGVREVHLRAFFLGAMGLFMKEWSYVWSRTHVYVGMKTNYAGMVNIYAWIITKNTYRCRWVRAGRLGWAVGGLGATRPRPRAHVIFVIIYVDMNELFIFKHWFFTSWCSKAVTPFRINNMSVLSDHGGVVTLDMTNVWGRTSKKVGLINPTRMSLNTRCRFYKIVLV